MTEASRQRRKPARSLEWKLDSRHKLQTGGLVVQTGLRDAIGLDGDLEDLSQAANVRLFRGLCCLVAGASRGERGDEFLEFFLREGSAFEDEWRQVAQLGRRRGRRRPPNEENRHKIQLGGLVEQTGLKGVLKLEGDLEKDPAQEENVTLLRGAFSAIARQLSGDQKIQVASALLERGQAFERRLAGGQSDPNSLADPYAVTAQDAAMLLGAIEKEKERPRHKNRG
jgi:hypothetical protein